MREPEMNPHIARVLSTSLKILLLLLILPGLVAWDLPFMSQRLRGDNDFKDEKYGQAIEHYNRAIESDGNDWELLYNLGTAYYESGQWENAVEELTYAVQIAQSEGASETDLAHILHNLGLAYIQLDDCGNAVPTLQQAVELAGDDEDIQRNFEFASDYCEDMPPECENTEGEEEDKGEGDEQDEEQGQADEGESNDESEAQDESQCEEGDQEGETGESDEEQDPSDSECEEGDQEGSGGNSENEQDETEKDQSDQTGDRGENAEEQGGQGEQDESAETEGDDEETDEPSEEEGSEDTNDTGGEQESDESEGEGDSTDEEGGGAGDGNAEESGPREIPDDGLNLSDSQIQDILDRMSRLEAQRAPRYFHSTPGDGDWLSNESVYDIFRRLFLGIPSDDSTTQPDDGIDW